MEGQDTKIFCFVLFFRAVPMAYGGSQARGLIVATAAGLHHSHSNARSEPHLRPTPHAGPLHPLSEARDRTRNLMVPSRIHYLCAQQELFLFIFFFFLWSHLWHMEVPRSGSIGAAAAGLRHSHRQHQIQSASATYTGASGNRSLTH